jgi:enamine deaminase RidA (YjgF/YER057c/UK114 family)
MNRTAINPHSWNVNLGFDQGELVEGHKRQLFASGQDAVDSSGTPQHPGDMAAQIDMALDNLEAVLDGAGMSFADVVRLNVHTTDMDELLKQFPRIARRFGDSRYATSVLGVTQLPAPDLVVLLEATAVD